ncbi:MAG: hypothetical protein K0S92_1390 [Desertimonas sp.]|nr:hypothetical protein [Desertimonas sp.]
MAARLCVVTFIEKLGNSRSSQSNPWQAEVLARVAVAEAMAESAGATTAPTPAAERTLGRIQRLLGDTREHATSGGSFLRRASGWRGGGPIERAWRDLHSAEILLVDVVSLEELSSQRPSVRSMAARVLPGSDPRALAVEHRLTNPAWDDLETVKNTPTEVRLRREFASALTWVNDGCDKTFTRVRSFRNIVLATTLGLLVVATGLGILGAFNPSSIPVCFNAGTVTAEQIRGEASPTAQVVCPTGAATGPSGGDVPLVLVVGLAAGAFAAALAVRGMRGTSTPYGVPVAIAVLKLPAGALTALFGMLMLRGGFIPGLSALDTQGQIIAYSIIFGYAQQVFTRMVDSQAQVVLDHAPSSEPSTAPAVRSGETAIAGSPLPTES